MTCTLCDWERLRTHREQCIKYTCSNAQFLPLLELELWQCFWSVTKKGRACCFHNSSCFVAAPFFRLNSVSNQMCSNYRIQGSGQTSLRHINIACKHPGWMSGRWSIITGERGKKPDSNTMELLVCLPIAVFCHLGSISIARNYPVYILPYLPAENFQAIPNFKGFVVTGSWFSIFAKRKISDLGVAARGLQSGPKWATQPEFPICIMEVILSVL